MEDQIAELDGLVEFEKVGCAPLSVQLLVGDQGLQRVAECCTAPRQLPHQAQMAQTPLLGRDKAEMLAARLASRLGHEPHRSDIRNPVVGCLQSGAGELGGPHHGFRIDAARTEQPRQGSECPDALHPETWLVFVGGLGSVSRVTAMSAHCRMAVGFGCAAWPRRVLQRNLPG
jgi:hypothetical protein